MITDSDVREAKQSAEREAEILAQQFGCPAENIVGMLPDEAVMLYNVRTGEIVICSLLAVIGHEA